MKRECLSDICECTGWCLYDTNEEWRAAQGIDDELEEMEVSFHYDVVHMPGTCSTCDAEIHNNP